METLRHTEAALCAGQIKKLLKEKYPTIKFSVRSKNFSMGNDVTVHWNFGPIEKEIDQLINGFQDGDFDGMNDLYTYRGHKDNIPRAKYVFATREYKTQEEIENNELKWNDPRHRDLWKEEKTFYHIVTRDLCTLFGLPMSKPENQAPKDLHVMSRSYNGYVCWTDIINSLLHDTPLMTGYHGVRLSKREDGKEIINVAEIY
jgi:hypothetical protein